MSDSDMPDADSTHSPKRRRMNHESEVSTLAVYDSPQSAAASVERRRERSASQASFTYRRRLSRGASEDGRDAHQYRDNGTDGRRRRSSSYGSRTSRKSRKSTPTDSPFAGPRRSLSGNLDLQPPGVRFREKLSLKGHTRGVAQAKFSPDGKWIATCSSDATIKVWDAFTGRLVHTLEGHLAGISTIAWSPDSKTIASGSDDKKIRLWNRATGKAYAQPFVGHHNYVFSVAFSPKGNMLASGSYDEALMLWDVRAAKLMRSLPAHQDPIGGVDFVRDGTLVVTCSSDGLIRIWDTPTGQCLRTIVHEDNAAVTSVQFSPNGRYILAWTLDGAIRLWDYVEGLCKKTYQGHLNKKYSLGGAFGVCETRAFIASGSEDGRVLIWDVNTKEVLQEWQAHDDVVLWTDAHPQLEMLVTCCTDGSVKVWINEPHGAEDREMDGELDDYRIAQLKLTEDANGVGDTPLMATPNGHDEMLVDTPDEQDVMSLLAEELGTE